ncbi:MAG: ribosomal protein S18-alanine N-acetyltransferase [Lachnospiraceae bacterium]|nr:ribosomal protein S18-alanine N-acetyltransferase [Lachnospiraceae bacterium]
MIRRMQQADLAGAAELESRYFSMPWSQKQLQESLENPDYLFLVLEREGKVAGYAGLIQAAEEGDITNVVLAEECRGAGLGKALVAALLEEGEKRGIREFTLEVRVSNTLAVHVYEALGFVKEGIRKRFYEKPSEDAWIMWRRDGSGSLFL